MVRNALAHSLLTLLTLLAFLPPLSMADEHSGQFRFNGFGTLGVTHNTDEDVHFTRDLSQNNSAGGQTSFSQDSLLGLQWQYQFNPNLTGVTQVVSKYQSGSYSPDITLFFLRTHLPSDIDIRVGRLNPDLFFRADSRDIGYSYLWSRAPVEFYGILNFNYFLGVDVVKKLFFDDGSLLSVKGYWGTVDQEAYVLDGGSGDFNHSPIYGIITDYEVDNWVFRLNLSHFQMKASTGEGLPELIDQLNTFGSFFPMSASIADELQTNGNTYKYYSLGTAWEQDNWRVQSALSYTKIEGLIPPSNRAAYISLGYQLDGWTPYLMVSAASGSKTSRTTGIPSGAPFYGEVLDQYVAQAIESSYIDQRTLTLGARFNIGNSSSLKAQIDRIHSDTPDSIVLQQENNWDGDTTVFSLTFDFVF